MKLRIYLLGDFIYWIYHHTPLERLFTLCYYSESRASDGKYLGDYIEIFRKRKPNRNTVNLVSDKYYQEYWD